MFGGLGNSGYICGTMELARIAQGLMAAALLLFGLDGTEVNAQGANDDYELVFSDEFSGRSGSRPDTLYWSVPPRQPSTWARWISNSPAVAYLRNGRLVCRAVRDNGTTGGGQQMMTGAVHTKDKFYFQYGKIEVRARTNLHEGNFPAIWLMPQPPCPSHPHGGEIDIFESFGTHRDAYHTVHTNWTLNLKKTTPKNSFVKNYFDVDKWHVYGLEWTEDMLRFTIDGMETGVYRKSSVKSELEQGQWPFDRPFYLILNQSVQSEGSWAGSPDFGYVYETQFDWVHVYRRRR